MVENTKTWISREQNIIFLRNKKLLICASDGAFWKSYHFLAEVTFKKQWLSSFAWKAIVCTTKVYLFCKREGWEFLNWEKCNNKDLIWHMVGEMVKKIG